MAVTFDPTKKLYTSETGQTFATHDEAASSLNPDYQVGQTDFNAISSKSLENGQSDIPFVSPQQSPTGAFPPALDFTPTKEEDEISSLIKGLQDTSSLSADESLFRTQQGQEKGIGGLETAVADYTAQYNQLAADFKSIEPQTEAEFRGRGSIGAITGETRARQREVLVRANTVQALLAGAQGRLTTALDQVDRAVDTKFKQAKLERDAKIENLNLLLQDPKLTLGQQKRAESQRLALEKEKEEDAKKEANTSTIMNWAVELAKNPLVAQQLMKEAQKDNPNLETAFALYSANQPSTTSFSTPTKDARGNTIQYQLDANGQVIGTKVIAEAGQEDELLTIDQAKELGVPYGTTKAQAIAMGKVPGQVTPEISPYQSERQTRILDSVKDLKNRVSLRTTGILALGKYAPGSVQRNFANDLQTLKANIAFGELTAMREASKTGGALGQVSNIELGLLESALAGLDQFQSPGNFKKNLQRIEDSLARWQDAVKKEIATSATKSGKPFDYAGAKAAGYSDEEITAYINAN